MRLVFALLLVAAVFLTACDTTGAGDLRFEWNSTVATDAQLNRADQVLTANDVLNDRGIVIKGYSITPSEIVRVSDSRGNMILIYPNGCKEYINTTERVQKCG